jgi:hypothetical protein
MAHEKTVAQLPLASYRAGESVISAESKTARLLILKTGEVAILRDSIEIARVEEHGRSILDRRGRMALWNVRLARCAASAWIK